MITKTALLIVLLSTSAIVPSMKGNGKESEEKPAQTIEQADKAPSEQEQKEAEGQQDTLDELF